MVLCFRDKVCEELHHLPSSSAPVVQWFCVSGTKFVRNFIIYPVILLLLFVPLAMRFIPSQPQICKKLLKDQKQRNQAETPKQRPRRLHDAEATFIDR